MRRIDRIRARRQFGPSAEACQESLIAWCSHLRISHPPKGPSSAPGKGGATAPIFSMAPNIMGTRDLGNLLSVLGNHGVTHGNTVTAPKKKRVAQIPSSAIWRVQLWSAVHFSWEPRFFERLKLNVTSGIWGKTTILSRPFQYP